MSWDITEMRDFYQTQLGGMFRFFLKPRIDDYLKNAKNQCILGLGYTFPYWSPHNDTSFKISGLDSKMGVMGWHHGDHGNKSLLLDGEHLPFPDQSMDRIFLIHYLEFSKNPETYLKEIWRVLTPEGSVLFTLPNRRGVWARFDHTPLGQGHPYTMTQMNTLLNKNGFLITKKSRCIYFPPLKNPFVVPFAHIMERIGHRLFGKFSGVITIEATKKVYGCINDGYKKPSFKLLEDTVTA